MEATKEQAQWRCRARVIKYHEDITPFIARGEAEEFHRKYKPYEIIEMEENCLLNAGITEMWNLIAGKATTHLDTTHAQLGVGNATTAASAAQTGLIGGTATKWNAMESTAYPSVADQAITLKSSFGTAEGNFVWAEWGIRSDYASVCTNRKVEALGEKTGGSWSLETTITLS